MKLTHLQLRRLKQLWHMGEGRQRDTNGYTLTSHWSSSRAANEKLCELGLAERYGHTFHHPSGKPNTVGDARITQAGRDYLANGEVA